MACAQIVSIHLSYPGLWGIYFLRTNKNTHAELIKRFHFFSLYKKEEIACIQLTKLTGHLLTAMLGSKYKKQSFITIEERKHTILS